MGLLNHTDIRRSLPLITLCATASAFIGTYAHGSILGPLISLAATVLAIVVCAIFIHDPESAPVGRT